MERVENSTCCDADGVNKPEGSIRTTDVHLLSVVSSTIRTAAWLKCFFPPLILWRTVGGLLFELISLSLSFVGFCSFL